MRNAKSTLSLPVIVIVLGLISLTLAGLLVPLVKKLVNPVPVALLSQVNPICLIPTLPIPVVYPKFCPLELNLDNIFNYSDSQTLFNTTKQVIQSFQPRGVHKMTVNTSGGYSVTVYRLLNNKDDPNSFGPGQAVLLMHGLMGNACYFVVAHSDKDCTQMNIAYELLKAGYDVYMMDNRGTMSTTEDPPPKQGDQFWNFRIDDMAADVGPVVTTILDMNKFPIKKIFCIAHSMAGAIITAALSTNVALNEQICRVILLAPAVKVSNIEAWVGLFYIAELVLDLLAAFDDNDMSYSVFPDDIINFVRTYGANYCQRNSLAKSICDFITNNLFGCTTNTALELIRQIIRCGLDRVTLNTLRQFAQWIWDDRFQKFDYRPNAGSTLAKCLPEAYHVENIKVPIAIIGGEKDFLVSQEDIYSTWDLLWRNVDQVMMIPEYGHMSFFSAVCDKVWVDFISHIKKILGTPVIPVG